MLKVNLLQSKLLDPLSKKTAAIFFFVFISAASNHNCEAQMYEKWRENRDSCRKIGEESFGKLEWMQWKHMERFWIFPGWKQTFEFAEGLLELHDPQGQFYYHDFKDR